MDMCEDQIKDLSFHVRYKCRESRRTTPMFRNELRRVSFQYWRLSSQDREDDVDLVNGKYLKIIMDVAKKHDKMILNVYESATPSFLKTSKI